MVSGGGLDTGVTIGYAWVIAVHHHSKEHTMNAKDRLQAKVEARTTAQLFEMLDMLDAMRVTTPGGALILATQEERIAAAAISDTIEAREGLAESMDRIFDNIDYTGTYTEALRQAMAEKV